MRVAVATPAFTIKEAIGLTIKLLGNVRVTGLLSTSRPCAQTAKPGINSEITSGVRAKTVASAPHVTPTPEIDLLTNYRPLRKQADGRLPVVI